MSKLFEKLKNELKALRLKLSGGDWLSAEALLLGQFQQPNFVPHDLLLRRHLTFLLFLSLLLIGECQIKFKLSQLTGACFDIQPPSSLFLTTLNPF